MPDYPSNQGVEVKENSIQNLLNKQSQEISLLMECINSLSKKLSPVSSPKLVDKDPGRDSETTMKEGPSDYVVGKITYNTKLIMGLQTRVNNIDAQLDL